MNPVAGGDVETGGVDRKLRPLTAMLTPAEIEAALVTLAELWSGGGDPHDVLTTGQTALAARLVDALAAARCEQCGREEDDVDDRGHTVVIDPQLGLCGGCVDYNLSRN